MVANRQPNFLQRVLRWPGASVEAAKAENLAGRRRIPNLDTDSRYLLRNFDRSKLRALARWCFENDGFTKQAIALLRRGVIGTGIHPLPLTSNEDWNVKAREIWIRKSRILDATGRLSFTELLGAWLTAMLVLGDQGIKLGSTPSGFPIVQSVMPHRIANWQGGQEDETLIDGVRIDAIGRPTGYRVLVTDGEADEVPASDFILLLDPHFSDTYRGHCEMGQALLKVLDHEFILTLETKGVFANLAPAIVSYTADGEPDLLKPSTGTETADVYDRDEATGGMILHRKIGDKVESFQSKRPTPGLAEFAKALQTPVALSLGVPVQWVLGDYQNAGPGIRAVISQADRRIAELQKLMTERVLNRLWFWVISKSIKAGELAENPEKDRVRWQFPQKQTVDNGRDSNAARSDLFAGLSTFEEDYSERGRDWRDAVEQKAIEAAFIHKMAAKYNVKPEEIAAIGNNPQPQTEAAPKPGDKKP